MAAPAAQGVPQAARVGGRRPARTSAAAATAARSPRGCSSQEFVTAGTPWVHLDIAGPARANGDDGYLVEGGTGFGVRTLVELVQRFEAPARRRGQEDRGQEAAGQEDRAKTPVGEAGAPLMHRAWPASRVRRPGSPRCSSPWSHGLAVAVPPVAGGHAPCVPGRHRSTSATTSSPHPAHGRAGRDGAVGQRRSQHAQRHAGDRRAVRQRRPEAGQVVHPLVPEGRHVRVLLHAARHAHQRPARRARRR